MKKIIVIILAILLAIFMGIILPILMNNSATGSTDENDLKREEGILELGMSDDIPGGSSNMSKSNDPEIDTSGDTSVSESEDDPTPMTTPINASEEDNKANDADKDDLDAENEVLSESWVDEMIREYGHHISDDDMDDLKRLYSRVDIAYLQGIMEDGYTDEEVEEVKAYLKERLGSDYLRGRELFYKYSYLMSEIEI
ncbi:MAG TPA: hypothetical protein GX727_05005 [Clostridium sp.]|nr:hypothetical protein [Clostridium sp.]